MIKIKIKANSRNYIFGGVFIAIFVVIGIYLLIGSHAASPYVSLNADQGSLSNGATLQSDSSASDGKYVQLGTVSSGGGSFVVGLNQSGWGTTGATNTAKLVGYDRWDTYKSSSEISTMVNDGLKVDVLFSGPYTHSGGISTISGGVSGWVTNKINYYSSYCNPTNCPSIEVL